MSRAYMLKCTLCGLESADDGLILSCPCAHAPALLVSHYMHEHFEPDNCASGCARYHNWLPCGSVREGVGQTAIYQSKRLSQLLKLPNLWIAFNGYWPEQGATLRTATFKEVEAYAVLSRLPQAPDRVMVVASAGNTAAAFAYLCSQNKLPCLIVVPEYGLQRMCFEQELDPCVKLLVMTGAADYYDAIQLAEHIARQPGFFYEGGVKNVGRRDGIGTTLLQAVETIGRLPDYYFQAIGSGTGGIGVNETARRLLADGTVGEKLPRQMVSQNAPFTPLYTSWQTRRRELLRPESATGRRQIQELAASVLSNQNPPYAIHGGVFDTLQESHGDMLLADNAETYAAMRLFQELEGIDIEPAAGVAFATLLQMAQTERIAQDEFVLLHITDGGWHYLHYEKSLTPARADLTVELPVRSTTALVEEAVGLFR